MEELENGFAWGEGKKGADVVPRPYKVSLMTLRRKSLGRVEAHFSDCVEGITITARNWLAQAGTSQKQAAQICLSGGCAAVYQILKYPCASTINLDCFSFPSNMSKTQIDYRYGNFFSAIAIFFQERPNKA